MSTQMSWSELTALLQQYGVSLVQEAMPTPPPQAYEPAPADVAHAVATLEASQPNVTIAGVPEFIRTRYDELVKGKEALPWKGKTRKDDSRFNLAKKAVSEYHKRMKFPGNWWDKDENDQPRATYDAYMKLLEKVAVLPARMDVQTTPPTQANAGQRTVAQEAMQNWLQQAQARNAENFARHVPVTAAVAPVRVVMPASGFPIARTNDTGQAWCECGGLRSKDTSVPCHNVHKDCKYAVPKGQPFEIVVDGSVPAPTQETPPALPTPVSTSAPATVIRMSAEQFVALSGNIPAGVTIEII